MIRHLLYIISQNWCKILDGYDRWRFSQDVGVSVFLREILNTWVSILDMFFFLYWIKKIVTLNIVNLYTLRITVIYWFRLFDSEVKSMNDVHTFKSSQFGSEMANSENKYFCNFFDRFWFMINFWQKCLLLKKSS